MSDGVRKQRPGSGVLGKNQRKREGHNDPGYTGSITTPDGREFWLSAWVKDGAKGKFFSLALKPKEALREVAKSSSPIDDEDVPRAGSGDDVPF